MIVVAMAEKGRKPDHRQRAEHQMLRVTVEVFRPHVVVRAEFLAKPLPHRLSARTPFRPHLMAPLALLLAPLVCGGVEPLASRTAAAAGLAARLRTFIDGEILADTNSKLAHGNLLWGIIIFC
jgi:hypothetical protein